MSRTLRPPRDSASSSTRHYLAGHPRKIRKEKAASYITITCGTALKEKSRAKAQDLPPLFPLAPCKQYSVPILPLPLDTPVSSLPTTSSTGCGAVVHRNPMPDRQAWQWTGKAADVGNSVIRISGNYFTEEEQQILKGVDLKDECGCLTVGVGCCVCGNRLGVRKTFCSQHRSTDDAIYTFLSDSVSPPVPPRPRNKRVGDAFSRDPSPPVPPRQPSLFVAPSNPWWEDEAHRQEIEADQRYYEATLRGLEQEAETEHARIQEAAARFAAQHALIAEP
ncbi:hypothetical protein R3P38DRAFT_1954896 [Favolaschia claudopus]|uniref:Uncharacterized protein n=1 Tax=Favolaschia claudopus TaxID=2862362 RepID=A0AAW0A036_9AGAR